VAGDAASEGREHGKLWLVLSCIDSRGCSPYQCSQRPRVPVRHGALRSLPGNFGRPLLQGWRALQCKKISVGDCLAEFFAQFNHFLCQKEVEICVKDNGGRVLSCSNHWREWTLIWIVPPNIPTLPGVENTWEILQTLKMTVKHEVYLHDSRYILVYHTRTCY